MEGADELLRGVLRRLPEDREWRQPNPVETSGRAAYGSSPVVLRPFKRHGSNLSKRCDKCLSLWLQEKANERKIPANWVGWKMGVNTEVKTQWVMGGG